MEHQERIRVAEELCDRMVEKYAGDILVGGVYGSTARHLDTAWSDLEMLFVTRDDCAAEGRHLVFRTIPVTYTVMKRGDLERLLANPVLEGDCGWPFYMGVLSVLKVLCGDASLVEQWLDMGRSVPDAAFRESLERELPGLVLESYGRIFSSRERGNQSDWYIAVLEVLFEVRDALCLLNRSWVMHDYMEGMKDTFRFAKLPRRYTELVPLLWNVRDIEDAVRLATELVEAFWDLLRAEGIELKRYGAVSEIPV